ncbi:MULTISPECIES: DUF6153 family protein [unclassified Streptomyces]|uniref:DUF6153 family protein n=1 Tax=unclassified Streptomyces TaxID=2593676 RepID=UPI002966CE18|nr:DUF6153 family protein [Streptomyces sp. SJL17-1]
MRTHRAERRRRAEGALARLLLVVVLALGVFLMHAVGHPEGSGGGTGTGSVSAHHSVAPPGDDGSDTGHEPGSGMDMTTLCVAVLAGWLFAGLVRAALGRRPDWLAPLLARLTPALGPHAPPPRAPDLAQLSVLRI